ncbi:14414_t:CDS:2, partial [Entrophospora sp. SA101]
LIELVSNFMLRLSLSGICLPWQKIHQNKDPQCPATVIEIARKTKGLPILSENDIKI